MLNIDSCNPYSKKFHSVKKFKESLRCTQKIKVIALTALAAIATLGLAAVAAFRFFVDREVRVASKRNEKVKASSHFLKPPLTEEKPPAQVPQPNAIENKKAVTLPITSQTILDEIDQKIAEYKSDHGNFLEIVGHLSDQDKKNCYRAFFLIPSKKVMFDQYGRLFIRHSSFSNEELNVRFEALEKTLREMGKEALNAEFNASEGMGGLYDCNFLSFTLNRISNEKKEYKRKVLKLLVDLQLEKRFSPPLNKEPILIEANRQIATFYSEHMTGFYDYFRFPYAYLLALVLIPIEKLCLHRKGFSISDQGTYQDSELEIRFQALKTLLENRKEVERARFIFVFKDSSGKEQR